MSNKVLVVDDEVKIVDLICKYLELEGFDYIQAFDGAEALLQFNKHAPDLVILDLMLPKMDGVAVCEKIRARSNTPIIMLTARVDEIDRLLGFSKGADDYVCKPFNPKELIARIKAILRRVQTVEEKPRTLVIGPITLHVDEYKVSVDDQEVYLTQIEFSLLNILMANPSHVYTREELLTTCQGHYSEPYERTIDFHVKNIRKKINITDKNTFIKTIYGVGYKFC